MGGPGVTLKGGNWMILPKGTLEFSVKGGEGAIEEVINKITEDKLTGYILILGGLENKVGDVEDITAQMVFKEGEPKLCETVVNDITHKGKTGIYPLLKSMIRDENSIEFKSKIDVEPPLAFFKECKIEEENLDIEAFKKEMAVEMEEIRKAEEERRRREEKKEQIKKDVESWTSSGAYSIPSYPSIMEKEFDEIESWYEVLSENISTIKDYLKWLLELDEVELEDRKGQLVELMKNPENMASIENAKSKLEADLKDITDKRSEMERWVKLWKDEGYNTSAVEEVLNEDLTTAWNKLTQFMDDIQHLKDRKEELEAIREEDEEDAFGAEVREIDLHLNDPAELSNIDELIERLKKTINEEKEAKETILRDAQTWKEKGFDISKLQEASKKRHRKLRDLYNLFTNNASRLMQIKEELSSLDRRDLADEIDRVSEGLKDPFELDEHEAQLIDLKERLNGLNQVRENIKKEMESIREQGYVVNELESQLDSPVEKLKGLKEIFISKINELKGLREKIEGLDSRWMEEEIETLKQKLNDPSNIDTIKEEINRLQERIEERENKREEIKKEMETWESEGFIVTRLKEVIEEDLPAFQATYRDLKDNIDQAKEQLERLSSLNVEFFQKRAGDLRGKLNDPDMVSKAKEDLEELEKDVQEDTERRSSIAKRLQELKGHGWKTEGLDDILKVQPQEIKSKWDELESRVKRMQEAKKEIEGWDKLEVNWLQKGIDELREHLRDLTDFESALNHFQELKNRVADNVRRRAEIRERLSEWKDAGYITRNLSEKIEGQMEELEETFQDISDRIGRLEKLQDRFDRLDTNHFKSEAEEIEFKMNDPSLVEKLEGEVEKLSGMIEEDQKKREDFLEKIENYVGEGFMGAEKLRKVMDEDISIVELEFKNFDKEVELFRKYMDAVGFVFPPPKSVSNKEEKKEE